MTIPLSDDVLDVLFRDARTHNAWKERDVPNEVLRHLVDLVKMGPTSANCSPARIIFVKSHAAKDRLKPFLSEGNAEKTMSAPVCAIIGHDLEFYEKIPELFPHNPEAREWFAHDKALAETTAFRNGTLQGAYLMIAARALGLDCGAMSGFDNAAVDEAYFPGGTVKSNFLCALGHGDPEAVFPRSPRPAFEDVCQIL